MSRTRMVIRVALLSMADAFVVGLVRNAGGEERRELKEKDAVLCGRISELEAGLPPEKRGSV